MARQRVKRARVRIRIRKDDTVEVITGRDRGKRGKVLQVLPDKGRVLVQGIGFVKRHTRPNPQRNIKGGILEREASIQLYTSGTTGRPKGAVLSHRALFTNLTTVARVWQWTEDDRLLLTLPCFHLHGLGLGILTSLLVGSSVALRPRFVAEEVLADLERTQATMFFGVPTIYNRLVSLPPDAFQSHDLRCMRLWVSGSAPLSAATYERFRERTVDERSARALALALGHAQREIRAGEPLDDLRRVGGQAEPRQDLVAHHGRGRRRARQHPRAGQVPDERADLEIFRAKVMPPLADAMGFVDRHERAPEVGEEAPEAGEGQPLGSDIDKLVRAARHHPHAPAHLAAING